MMTHEESNVQQVQAGLGKPIKGNIEDKKMKEIAEYAVNTRWVLVFSTFIGSLWHKSGTIRGALMP